MAPNHLRACRPAADKDNSFLRIGSLNVRVKKTTEAFNSLITTGLQMGDRLHGRWGSSDSVNDVSAPPPRLPPLLLVGSGWGLRCPGSGLSSECSRGQRFLPGQGRAGATPTGRQCGTDGNAKARLITGGTPQATVVFINGPWSLEISIHNLGRVVLLKMKNSKKTF